MDKLDNIMFVIVSMFAAMRGLMIYRVRVRRETLSWRAIMLLAIVAMLSHAALQSLYVFSIRVPNGWYESVAHLMALAVAVMVVGMSVHGGTHAD